MEDHGHSSLVAATEAMDLGRAAWEDGGTLQMPMSLAEPVTVAGRVSIQVNAVMIGPKPLTAQLLVVFPVRAFDLELEASLEVVKGVQRWMPGTPGQLKLINWANDTKKLERGVQVATAYATNCSEVGRMFLLKEPTPPFRAECEGEAEEGKDEPPEGTDTPEGMDTPRVQVSDANTGQLSHGSRHELQPFPTQPQNGANISRSRGGTFKDEDCLSIAAKQQLMNPHQEDMMETDMARLKRGKFLRTSTSRHCARTVFTAKSNGEVRVCQDYRALNAHLKDDQGAIGHLGAMYYRMAGARYVSVFDLASAYMQLPIMESDRHKTAFRDSHGRLCEYNVCGFGLKPVPAVFSTRLDDDLHPVLHKGVEKWLDDLLLHSKTLEEHLAHSGRLGNPVQRRVLRAFLQLQVVLCGTGIRRGDGRQGRVAAVSVQNRRPGGTGAAVDGGRGTSFLGLAGFLRDFVPNFSGIVAPISVLLRNKKVPWGPEQTAAMLKIVELLVSPQGLALPDWDQKFTLHTDASTLAAGPVLTQELESRAVQLAFASHRWSRSDEKCSANDREVLAVLWATDHYRSYLLFKKFTLVTDCGAILWLFDSQHLSPKMLLWALKLWEFDMELQWRKGTDHVVPDALSRLRLEET